MNENTANSEAQTFTKDKSIKTPLPKLLRVSHVVELLGIPKPRVYLLVRRAHDPLPSFKLGRGHFFKAQEIEKWQHRQNQHWGEHDPAAFLTMAEASAFIRGRRKALYSTLHARRTTPSTQKNTRLADAISLEAPAFAINGRLYFLKADLEKWKNVPNNYVTLAQVLQILRLSVSSFYDKLSKREIQLTRYRDGVRCYFDPHEVKEVVDAGAYRRRVGRRTGSVRSENGTVSLQSVAQLLGKSEATLQRDLHITHIHPVGKLPCGSEMYRRTDIDNFLQEQSTLCTRTELMRSLHLTPANLAHCKHQASDIFQETLWRGRVYYDVDKIAKWLEEQ